MKAPRGRTDAAGALALTGHPRCWANVPPAGLVLDQAPCPLAECPVEAAGVTPISEDMLSCLLPQRLQLHIKVRSQLSGKRTTCGHQPFPHQSPPGKSLRGALCQSTPSKKPSETRRNSSAWASEDGTGRQVADLATPTGLMGTCPRCPATKQLAKSRHGPSSQPHPMQRQDVWSGRQGSSSRTCPQHRTRAQPHRPAPFRSSSWFKCCKDSLTTQSVQRTRDTKLRCVR